MDKNLADLVPKSLSEPVKQVVDATDIIKAKVGNPVRLKKIGMVLLYCMGGVDNPDHLVDATILS